MPVSTKINPTAIDVLAVLASASDGTTLFNPLASRAEAATDEHGAPAPRAGRRPSTAGSEEDSPLGLSYMPQLAAGFDGELSALFESVAGGRGFVSADELRAAVGQTPEPQSTFSSLTRALRTGGLLRKGRVPLGEPDGRVFTVTAAPGVVALAAKDPVRAAKSAEREAERQRRKVVLLAADLRAGREPKPKTSRQKVKRWSRKSRALMVRRLAELDYGPLFDGTRLPAMITLTYPGDWETVAPNGKAVKRHLDLWRKRYERAWGEKLRCVWKLEFQDRGAPHLHLFMLPPRGAAKRGEAFKAWLSPSWAAVVNHPDPAQRANHLRAGTAVDYAKGLRSRDPRRLAKYFAKHGGAAGGKEYQHEVPELWQQPGQGPGRFWGYVGLHRLSASSELDMEDFILAKRLLRRWSRSVAYYPPSILRRDKMPGDEKAKGHVYPLKVEARTVQRQVRRGVYGPNLMSGVVFYDQHGKEFIAGEPRYRRTTCRRQHLDHASLTGGFVLVNDGALMTRQLAAALRIWRDALPE